MGQVTFTPAFSGGEGDLYIKSDENGTEIHFSNQATQAVTLGLHIGHHILSVWGAAPDGTGKTLKLAITGDLPAEVDESFPAGQIPPHNIIVFVTQ